MSVTQIFQLKVAIHNIAENTPYIGAIAALIQVSFRAKLIIWKLYSFAVVWYQIQGYNKWDQSQILQ